MIFVRNSNFQIIRFGLIPVTVAQYSRGWGPKILWVLPAGVRANNIFKCHHHFDVVACCE